MLTCQLAIGTFWSRFWRLPGILMHRAIARGMYDHRIRTGFCRYRKSGGGNRKGEYQQWDDIPTSIFSSSTGTYITLASQPTRRNGNEIIGESSIGMAYWCRWGGVSLRSQRESGKPNGMPRVPQRAGTLSSGHWRNGGGTVLPAEPQTFNRQKREMLCRSISPFAPFHYTAVRNCRRR